MSDFIFTPENVNNVILMHMGKWAERIEECHPVNSKDTIEMLRFAITALSHLQHDLHLCHCDNEAYKKSEVEE